MDDLSKLSQGLGASGIGSDAAAAASGLPQAIDQAGGLDGLLGRLRAGGLGDQVDSWVSDGPNQPVDPQRLGSALGPDTVQQMAAGSGLDIGALLPMLAAFLPQLVNMLTPDGRTPDGGLANATGGLPDLGGLLGGLLGGVNTTDASGSARDQGAGLDDLLGGLGGMLGGDKGR